MSKVLAGALTFAVLVWSAANAPGWSLGRAQPAADAAPSPEMVPGFPQDPILLASLGSTEDLDIEGWLARAQQELDEQRAAWNQLDPGQLKFAYEAPERYSSLGRHGGGASSDGLLAYSGGSRFDGGADFGGSLEGFRGVPGGSSGGKGPKGGPSGSNPPGSPNEHPAGGTGEEHPSTNPQVTPPTGENSHTNPPETNPPGTNPPEKNNPEGNPPGGNPPENPNPWIPENPGSGPGTPPVAVPEPGSMGLLGLALAGLGLFRRRASGNRA